MDKPDEISEENLSKLRFIVNAATSKGFKNILMLTEEMLVLITEIERLRAENVALNAEVNEKDEELAKTWRWLISPIGPPMASKVRDLQAERDQLAALVECATNFDADEKTIIVQINWEQKNVWIVERDEVEGKLTGWLCEGGQWISWGNGGSAHAAEKFPTREAAFIAFEAVRAKEEAE